MPEKTARKAYRPIATEDDKINRKKLRERLEICSLVNPAANILLSCKHPDAWSKAEHLIEEEEKLRPLPGKESELLGTASRLFIGLVLATFVRGGPIRRTKEERIEFERIQPIDEFALAALAIESELSRDNLALKTRLPFLEKLAENERLTGEVKNQVGAVLALRNEALNPGAEPSRLAGIWDVSGLPMRLKAMAKALQGKGMLSAHDLGKAINGEPSRILSDHRSGKWKNWVTTWIGRRSGSYWLKNPSTSIANRQ